ncbi:MAG: hypothetical protein CSB28_00005 [Desulfobacterales bacterium]|nr:MAG: hypothetical protein CSB28_00005 [Desulfobacterales bacterium]
MNKKIGDTAVAHDNGREKAEDNEERLRALSEVSFEAILMFENGMCLDQNQTAEKIFGYTKAEAIGKKETDWIAPIDREQVSNNLHSGHTAPYEVTALRKDGTTFPCEMQARLTSYQGRSILITAWRDISDRKRSEKALLESETKYKRIFENLQDVYYEVSMAGIILEISPSIENISLYKREELIGKSLYHIYQNPSDREVLINQLLETGKVNDYEINLKDKDDSTRRCSITSLLVKDPQGNPEKQIGSMRDITGRKRAEKEALEREKFISLLCDSMPIGVFYKDNRGHYQGCNRAFTEITGITPVDIPGKTINELWPGGTAPNSDQEDIDWIEHEDRKLYEFEIKDKEGKVRPIICAKNVFRDEEGEVTGIIGAFIDITDRKQAEKALKESEEKLTREQQLTRLQKMESLGLLVSGVAHDMNNILSGIVSYPELILMSLPEDSELRKPIEMIQVSGHRMAAIVQDLLTVARGAARTHEPLNINDIINEYLKSPEYFKLQDFLPTVSIKTKLARDLFNMAGSPDHIRKVIMNLVSNASEAITGHGNVTISTTNIYVDEPLDGYEKVEVGEYVLLSVADDGPGISACDLERICEPFYTKKVLGRSGTGLGLTVVLNVIRSHKGYINIKTGQDGTTFYLYFPVTRENIPVNVPAVSTKISKGNGESILIVDDVESQRDITCQMLDKLNYKTKAVASGEDAVEYMKTHSVDLLLLDMIMAPGINGRETYERILKIHPNQKAILVSGFAETKDVKRAQELGAGKYIRKPITFETIGLAVKEELEK